MRFAEVAVALPLEGPFDYVIPQELDAQVHKGSRVWVNFNNRKVIGYILGIKDKSEIKKIKPVISCVDNCAIISPEMFLLAEEISKYYCCSFGDAVEAILPEGVRKARNINLEVCLNAKPQCGPAQIFAYPVRDETAKWSFFYEKINLSLANSRQVIIIAPQVSYLKEIQARLDQFKDRVFLLHSYQTRLEQLESWRKARNGVCSIVLGTMGAVFAPCPNLGLIIIDEESDENYKQRQSPFYHARTVALMRSKLEGADVVLSDNPLSLETVYSVKKGRAALAGNLSVDLSSIKVKAVNMEDFYPKKFIITPFLEERLSRAVSDKKKSLVLFNRKGHSTVLSCDKCDFVLRCQRCSASLVFDKQKNRLVCNLCLSVYPAPDLCPNCKNSYVKYKGLGIEKVYNKLNQLLPSAKILLYAGDNKVRPNFNNYDIVVATSAIFKIRPKFFFDLSAVLTLDYLFNLPDYNVNEKIFNLLVNLRLITKQELVIETGHVNHPCVKLIKDFDPEAFYEYELAQRKDFGFPPFRHIVNINLRSKSELTAETKAKSLYDVLSDKKNGKDFELFEPIPKSPYKLRNNYYWQIITKCSSVKDMSALLKNEVAGFNRSGAIVTVDVDAS